MARKKGDDDAIRITTAPEPRSADITRRQKSYLISMSIRSLCFIGAIIAGITHVNWLWPILIVGALVLPYIAVVRANAAKTKGEDVSLMESPYGRFELRGGPVWLEEKAWREAQAQRAAAAQAAANSKESPEQ